MKKDMIKWVAGAALLLGGATSVHADTDRIAELEQRLNTMSAELDALKTQQTENKGSIHDLQNEDSPFSFGGYGEIHFNFSQGTEGGDQVDLHRLVLYAGYDFNDWIKFNTEIEIEHALVSNGDGQLAVEQAYVDFSLNPKFNLRAGRVLVPVGIVNRLHEPTLFYGVERPNVDKYIIPGTWFGDGVGAYGQLNDKISYEAYLVGGLDGSKFNASSGIRGGRMESRPSLNNPALTGRIDYYALQKDKQNLRVGFSGYGGGVNNGEEGKDSGAAGEVVMLSADFDYIIKNVDLRGEIAHTHFSGAAENTAGVGEEMLGWYLQAGVHVLPDSFKQGKLEQSDLVLFSRYERYNTQQDMPTGIAADGNNDRTDITFGANFYLTQQFVVKADYQIKQDEAGENPASALNLGLGWTF